MAHAGQSIQESLSLTESLLVDFYSHVDAYAVAASAAILRLSEDARMR